MFNNFETFHKYMLSTKSILQIYMYMFILVISGYWNSVDFNIFAIIFSIFQNLFKYCIVLYSKNILTL